MNGKAAQAVFVTGAASGIGRAIALFYARRGWCVGLADIDPQGLAATAALMPEAAVSVHRLDVRDRSQWAQALAAFVADSGRLDLLVANAGVVKAGAFVDVAEADHDRMVDVNLKGVMNAAAAGHAWLKHTAGSALVITCSAAGLKGVGNMATYAATKFAVRGLAESLDHEWAADGIAVRTIMPGFIDTPLLAVPAPGTNHSLREQVAGAGLEFTPVEQVAEAVERARTGARVHHPVGPTARRLALWARLAPQWLHDRVKRQGLAGGKR